MFETISPNMNLPIPGVGLTDGPQYALDVNICLTLIDAHNHSPGQGAQINTDGLNINADLPIQGFNFTDIRSARFEVQASPLGLGTDLGAIYVSGVDLYYNDVSGNQVRITQSGGVAGSPGSISGLVAPASASYVALSGKFVFQSAALTSADLDFGSAIMRNPTPSSFALTLSPPTLTSNYTITLPLLPVSELPLVINSSGVMAARQLVNADISSSAAIARSKISPAFAVPTLQKFLSGSGTYTTPANVTYIRVIMVGGGGGGAGSADGTNNGGSGGNGGGTTFGTALLAANAGAGAAGAGANPGAGGGAASLGTGPVGLAISGGRGGGSQQLIAAYSMAGMGGASALGGNGGNGEALGAGLDGQTNTGGGGGGGGGTGAGGATNAGAGGGAGGFIQAIITGPSATYSYAVGAAGTAGAAGTGGRAGGAGGSGVIVVEEYYQ